jgi:hypothetical protein
MKIIIPFLFVIIFFGCSEKKEDWSTTEKPAAVKLDTLAIGKQIYFTQNLTDTNYTFPAIITRGDSDDVQIISYPDLVRRNDDSLFLKCDNGKIIKLVNNRSEDDNYKLFRFVELNKDIDHYLIGCLRVESFNYLLVNKKNGNPIETIGPPFASPDKNFFVCGNCDLVANFNLNGIEVYKKGKSSYQSLGLRELTNWGPDQMLWKNDSTLIIKASQLKADNTTLEKIYKSTFYKIIGIISNIFLF